jgi:very-short-patch-repair endonuclease
VFEQLPLSHLKSGGCFKCGHKKLTTEEFIKRAKEVHGDKYDYSLVDYKNMDTKVKIICPIHGVFEQLPYDHLNGCNCTFCRNILSGRAKNNNYKFTFIKRAKEIHGDRYDYSLIDYKKSEEKIKIICHKHGIFEQTPHDHLCGRGCPHCKISKGEVKILNWLKSNNFLLDKDFFHVYKFDDLKGERFLLSYDFYFPKKKLLIEFNGEQHYKNAFNKRIHDFHKQLHYDWLKRKYARDNGYKLLTIPYWDYKIIEEILEENLRLDTSQGEINGA